MIAWLGLGMQLHVRPTNGQQRPQSRSVSARHIPIIPDRYRSELQLKSLFAHFQSISRLLGDEIVAFTRYNHVVSRMGHVPQLGRACIWHFWFVRAPGGWIYVGSCLQRVVG